jgi:hypothetical protein
VRRPTSGDTPPSIGAENDPEEGGMKRVLVVEDDPHNALLFKKLLGSAAVASRSR